MKKQAQALTPVQHALERERLHLAEELHEGLCQQLCGVSIHLKILERRLTKEASPFPDTWAELQQSIETAIDDTRFLYRMLKPPIWDIPSLATALQELTGAKGGAFADRSAPATGDTLLPTEAALGLFRIAQEALRALRHLSTTPTWGLSLRTDEATVQMALEIDSQSGQEILMRGLWKGLEEVAPGLVSLVLEQAANPFALICTVSLADEGISAKSA